MYSFSIADHIKPEFSFEVENDHLIILLDGRIVSSFEIEVAHKMFTLKFAVDVIREIKNRGGLVADDSMVRAIKALRELSFNYYPQIMLEAYDEVIVEKVDDIHSSDFRILNSEDIHRARVLLREAGIPFYQGFAGPIA